MDLKEQLARDLVEARCRTPELLAPLNEEQLTTQHDQLMSPPVWDYAHIGVFEELWLVHTLSGAAPIDQSSKPPTTRSRRPASSGGEGSCSASPSRSLTWRRSGTEPWPSSRRSRSTKAIRF